jgi:hypothetical protein
VNNAIPNRMAAVHTSLRVLAVLAGDRLGQRYPLGEHAPGHRAATSR